MIELDNPYKDLIEKWFSNPEKRIHLKKGDILLEQNQPNNKLFLVISGKLYGFLPDSMVQNYPAFEAHPGKFVGVYSYFSKEGRSYTRVQAAEDAEIAFYERPLTQHPWVELEDIMPSILSVIVNEISNRQQFARHMAKESQTHLQKLMKTEKMVTLGQMAAGLAHELNNSIGVLSSNLAQVEDFVRKCLGKGNSMFFEKGLQSGQSLSSAEARKLRGEYEKKLNIKGNLSRRLAKTGIDPRDIVKVAGKDPVKIESIYEEWEAGTTLYDMKISSKQSAHVVRSVKQLGVAEHSWSKEVNINDTIHEALAILRSLAKKVDVQIDLRDIDLIEAIPGELVQVWINLMKNALESMLGANTKDPLLKVRSSQTKNNIHVSVTDNGPGIPTQIREKIFEPSFTTKVGGLSFGLGLGLSIVQRIIESHGGTINLNSKPGQTEFLISLPKNN